MKVMKDFDVVIVGSGLAGLTAAMQLAPTHRVAILTKRSMNDGSSGWAQGGIAAVMAEDDSFQSHVDDTLVAGAGLSQLDATRFVVEHAPESIAWLRELGVPFSQENGHLHLTREGGHSARRIVHVTDATGAAVQQTLIEHVKRTPNITLFDLRTEKVLRVNRTRVSGFFDVYNIFNANEAQTLTTTSGSAWLFPAAITPPRVARVGLKFSW